MSYSENDYRVEEIISSPGQFSRCPFGPSVNADVKLNLSGSTCRMRRSA